MTENYSAFAGLNLSDARSKNETREEYKLRLKQNRQVMINVIGTKYNNGKK